MMKEATMLNIHFSQLPIISIPRCMAKEAVISSSGRNPEILQSKIFIYSMLLEQLEFIIFLVVHFQKGYYKNLSEELMSYVL